MKQSEVIREARQIQRDSNSQDAKRLAALVIRLAEAVPEKRFSETEK